MKRVMIQWLSWLLCLVIVSPATAQDVGNYGKAPRTAETGLPDALREVAFDQKLGEKLPLDATFRDESGATVALADYFDGDKPVVLTLVYFECPMLCSLVLNGVVRSLRVLKFDVGKEFDMLTISIDPDETPELARAKKENYVGLYKREGAENGWHFLTGEQDAIQRVADAVGFRYTYDPQSDEFAHAAGIVVLTPDGVVSRYFYGVDFPPRDLRLGLVEATDGGVGNAIDQALLFCYRYDPESGTYSAVVFNILKIAAILTLVGLALLFYFLRRRSPSATLTSRVAS